MHEERKVKFKRTLDEILGNKKRLTVLRYLFHYPGEFTGRHIARLCSLSQASIQAHLKALADNDILKVNYIGRSRIFKLNKQNILYKPLEELFRAEDRLVHELERIIKDSIKQNPRLRESLGSASIYGSILTSEARPDSDIDLFLLFKNRKDEKAVDEHFRELEARINTLFGNRLHLYATNIAELEKLRKSKKAIFNSLRSSHLVYGEELDKLMEQDA
jgi:DNA-binding transcriptional ArsR family regulator